MPTKPPKVPFTGNLEEPEAGLNDGPDELPEPPVFPKLHPTMGKKIEYLRVAAGLSKRGLACIARCSPSAIVKYEKQLETPSYEMASRLAWALGVQVEWIWDHGAPPHAISRRVLKMHD